MVAMSGSLHKLGKMIWLLPRPGTPEMDLYWYPQGSASNGCFANSLHCGLTSWNWQSCWRPIFEISTVESLWDFNIVEPAIPSPGIDFRSSNRGCLQTYHRRAGGLWLDTDFGIPKQQELQPHRHGGFNRPDEGALIAGYGIFNRPDGE